MRRVGRALPLVLVLLVTTSARRAPSRRPGSTPSPSGCRTAFDVPGISLAIVKDDKVVVARGYGVRKLGAPEPVDARHAVRHRLEHQGLHGDGPRHAGRGRQAGVGRAGRALPALVPAVRSVS